MNHRLQKLGNFEEKFDFWLKSLLELKPKQLWEKVYAICSRGKQLRPELVKSLFRIYKPHAEIPDGLIRDSAALELIHSSTLIHDDIIDFSSHRRKIPTINYTHSPEIALLVGNLVKDTALTLATKPAIPILNLASRDVNLGQLWETIGRHQDQISILDYLAISLYKAAKMFRYSVDLASLYTEKPFGDDVSQAFELVAIAYQAADDWLDMNNSSAQTGKSSSLDGTNNVHSFMSANWDDNDVNNTIFCGEILNNNPALERATKCVNTIINNYPIKSRLIDLSPTESSRILLQFFSEIHKACHLLLSEGSNGLVVPVVDEYINKLLGQLRNFLRNNNIHFNNIAENYTKVRPSHPPLIEMLSRILYLKKGMHVLDVGCGPAHDLVNLREKYGIIPFGIDSSEKMVELAAHAIGSESVICSDAISFMNSNNGIFDAAYLKFSAHHFGDLDKLFSCLYGVLKPGARIAIVTMYPDDVESFQLIKYFPTLKNLMTAEAKRQRFIESILHNLSFKEIACSPCEIYNLRYDKKLIELISARFISFLNDIPEEELSEGINKLSSHIQSLIEPYEISVEGKVIHARE